MVGARKKIGVPGVIATIIAEMSDQIENESQTSRRNGCHYEQVVTLHSPLLKRRPPRGHRCRKSKSTHWQLCSAAAAVAKVRARPNNGTLRSRLIMRRINFRFRCQGEARPLIDRIVRSVAHRSALKKAGCLLRAL
jgi:hypothetical protein